MSLKIVIARPGWRIPGLPYVGLLAVAFVLAAVFPFVSAYIQSMFTEILIYAIFALSLNLLIGYSGLFSLGHAAYFGVAAYSFALLSTRAGMTDFWLLAVIGVSLSAVLSAFFGAIALRASGVQFLLVTLAIGQLLYSVATKWRTFTGGANGVPAIPFPDLGATSWLLDSRSYFYLVLAVFLVSFIVLYLVANSPFGHALRGIHADEGRMNALGYNTWLFKYIAIIIAGLFAGLAGVLYAPFAGLVGPMHLSVTTSSTVMLMVIIGSETVFAGPVLGAAIVILLEYVASVYMPGRWPLVLGAVFVLAVMFLRGGVSVHLLRLWNGVTRERRSA